MGCCLLRIAVLALSLAPPAAKPAAVVSVELASGRKFTGVLDARTTGHQLWLRWHVGEVELQRPIDWNRITAAQLGGKAIEIADLRDRAAELATPGRTIPLGRVATERGETTPVVPAVVRSIHCDAWLANWDQDAEFDGLVVAVDALDQFGVAILATGTIEADLVTLDYVPAYQASSSGGRIPIKLGRWSQPWQSQRRYVQLEFQGRPPHLTPSLDRYALLHVRVAIPGHGVFEQELDGIRTRPFTPVKNAFWR